MIGTMGASSVLVDASKGAWTSNPRAVGSCKPEIVNVSDMMGRHDGTCILTPVVSRGPGARYDAECILVANAIPRHTHFVV